MLEKFTPGMWATFFAGLSLGSLGVGYYLGMALVAELRRSRASEGALRDEIAKLSATAAAAQARFK